MPYRFAGDLYTICNKLGTSAAQYIRAAGRKIDMHFSIAHAIVTALVARGCADRHAQEGSRFEGLVKAGQRLVSPGYFRRTPADADDRRLVLTVMNGHGDRIEETLVRIRGKIYRDT